MKETITKYYCDKCGAEIKAYGYQHEIENGYGYIEYKVNCIAPYDGTFHRSYAAFNSHEPGTNSMLLCKKCFDGLTNYLKGE